MMDPLVHRRALLAALKTTKHAEVERGSSKSALLRTTLAIGLTGGFVGCALQHGNPPTVFEDAAPLADAPSVIDVGHDVPPDAPIAPDVPGLPDAPIACDEHLGALAITSASESDWSPAQFTDETARALPETVSCCHQMELDVRAAHERGERTEWPPTSLAMACCEVVMSNHLEPFSELGCTPWGPPCPPEMVV